LRVCSLLTLLQHFHPSHWNKNVFTWSIYWSGRTIKVLKIIQFSHCEDTFPGRVFAISIRISVNVLFPGKDLCVTYVTPNCANVVPENAVNSMNHQ
jgi:hypothetical protein